MAKPKKYKVNKDKIDIRLKEKGITLKDLASETGFAYGSLWRDIRGGGLGIVRLEKICEYLDLAPEYVTDQTDDWFTGETVFNYSFHLRQEMPSKPCIVRKVSEIPLSKNGKIEIPVTVKEAFDIVMGYAAGKIPKSYSKKELQTIYSDTILEIIRSCERQERNRKGR